MRFGPADYGSLNLAVIGNCNIAALIDRHARIVWFCLPRFDGDPVFNALLQGLELSSDECTGQFDVAVEDTASTQQEYIENTAVVRTTVADRSGNTLEVIDFAPRFTRYGRRFRPGTLIRRLAPIDGRPRIRLRIRPTFDYNSTKGTITRGSNHIRYVGSSLALRLTTDAPLSYILDETWFYLDRPITIWLGPDETLQGPVDITGDEFLRETISYWRDWVRSLTVPFEWQEAVIRAAIVLKLCWFEETGAIVAALTTSIPESPDSGRNWDYRYCWIRDSYYVIQALGRLGAVDIMESYLIYLRNLPGVTRVGELQPVYGIALEATLSEAEKAGLLGYRNMGPVRTGNQAYAHQQNDVYGQVILALTQAFFDRRLQIKMTADDYDKLERVGERAFAQHDKPDAGLWELRRTARIHTYSIAMCWAACDRLSKVAAHLGFSDKSYTWQLRANTISEMINEELWSTELNSFVSAKGSDDVDASVLQLFEIGVVPDADRRLFGTLARIERTLNHSGHIFRYAAADDFGFPQTAFNICTFWYVDALYRCGRVAEARKAYESILMHRNHVDLLSEDVDVPTGELWGNFPQTYSQVGIINSAMRLSLSWRDAI